MPDPTCTICDTVAEHHISVRDDHPEPNPGEKDNRAVRNVPLCKGHWHKLKEFLGLGG